MNVIEGSFITEDVRIAIVASRFNEFITSKLIGGAEDALLRHDIDPERSILHGFQVLLRSRW